MRAGLGIGHGMFVGMLVACTGSNLPARTETARAGLERPDACTQELTRRLGPKLLEFEKGDCEGTASVHPPEDGRCAVRGLESTPERVLPLHVLRSLALGGTLEICGIPVTCECEGYPPAEPKE